MEALDTQVARLEKSFQDEDYNRDWSSDIRAAPECVWILAECLLVTSKSDSLAIELKGQGLEYDYLSANVRHCEQVGKDTLKDTDEDMKRVAVLASELGRENGVIELILRFCQPNQSAAHDRLLKRLLTKGQKMVKESVDKITSVRERFRAWVKLTVNILRALEDKSSENLHLEREKKKQAEANKTKIELNTEDNIKEGKCSQEHKERLQETKNFKKWYDSHFGKMVSAATMAESLATAVAMPVLGVPLVIGTGCAWIHYLMLKDEIEKGEQAEKARQAEIRRLEEETAELKNALKELANETSSISTIKGIVSKSIYRLHMLQQHIDNFMTFLITLQRIINRTVENSDIVFGMAEDKEGLPEIKSVMLASAFDMKTRFQYAAMVSAIYSEVSSTFVLPEVARLTTLELHIERTDAQLEEKVLELAKNRRTVGKSAADLVVQKQAVLKNSLQGLVESSAISLRNIEPELLGGN